MSEVEQIVLRVFFLTSVRVLTFQMGEGFMDLYIML